MPVCWARGRYILVKPRRAEAIAKAAEDVYNGSVKQSDKRIFSWDECVDRYLEVYDELVGTRVKGG
jgi:glycogen synthase